MNVFFCIKSVHFENNFSKIVIGSSLMSKDMGQPFDLGGGVEAWFGHFQSLRLGWKPFMIIDASQRAFVKGGAVHDMFAQECGFRSAQELRDWRPFNEANFGLVLHFVFFVARTGDIGSFFLLKQKEDRHSESRIPARWIHGECGL